MATDPAAATINTNPAAAAEINTDPAAATAAGQSPNCPCPDIVTIPKVDIDKDGLFKYVAFTVRDPKIRSGIIPVVIIRGYKRQRGFMELIEEVTEQQQPLICEPFMGGFINNDSANKSIHIFGTSPGVDRGKPDRKYIATLIEKEFPGFKVTTGEKNIPPPPTPATAAAPAPETSVAPAPPAAPAPETTAAPATPAAPAPSAAASPPAP